MGSMYGEAREGALVFPRLLILTASWCVGLAACGGEPAVVSQPQVRAVVVEDEAQLFGGISAEGQAGDILLENDAVRFVIQGLRLSGGYITVGGTVIDADIVRPDGQPGRDQVDEWSPLVGISRVSAPTSVAVIADGSLGGPAIVEVRGNERALALFEGALEAPGFVPDLGLTFVTRYALSPGSHLLHVTTTVTADGAAPDVALGDALIGARELGTPFHPGAGLAQPVVGPWTWTGHVSDHDDVALIMAAAPGETLSSEGADLLVDLAGLTPAFSASVDLAAGQTHTHTRYYGVGPDLGVLSDAVQRLHGVETKTVEGVVTAPDGPVSGARVNVIVDGAPYTIARSDAAGAVTAQVAAGSDVVLEAMGRGPALFIDLPPGAPPISAYAAPPVQARALQALADGASPVARVEGRGVSTDLTLGAPAALTVKVEDGRPFAVQVRLTAPDAAVDPARVPPRPAGLAAAGWSRDGQIRLDVEPGTYDVVVHRGVVYEVFEERVTLDAGGAHEVDAVLARAFDHDGWLVVDPHMHASPSIDGLLPMVDRLVAAAAVGLQVHIGTDHDNLADYRPLVDALGLSPHLTSVVADEVSPPLRGHFNIYPVDPAPRSPNGGAWTWWLEVPTSTDGMMERLRELHGTSYIAQANHPTELGVGDAGGWSPGRVGSPDKFTEQFDAVEVLNGGEHADFTAFWLDLVLRGHAAVPVGVSDSHDHFGGLPGLSVTFFGAGVDTPAALTDDLLTETLRAGRVVPGLGVFLSTDPAPGALLQGNATVAVTARSASWARVDRLILFRDGVEVQRIDGTTASFDLAPDVDALYTVVAEGDAPMSPLAEHTPWALAGPWRVDVDGEGWTPPLPPLME